MNLIWWWCLWWSQGILYFPSSVYISTYPYFRYITSRIYHPQDDYKISYCHFITSFLNGSDPLLSERSVLFTPDQSPILSPLSTTLSPHELISPLHPRTDYIFPLDSRLSSRQRRLPVLFRRKSIFDYFLRLPHRWIRKHLFPARLRPFELRRAIVSYRISLINTIGFLTLNRINHRILQQAVDLSSAHTIDSFNFQRLKYGLWLINPDDFNSISHYISGLGHSSSPPRITYNEPYYDSGFDLSISFINTLPLPLAFYVRCIRATSSNFLHDANEPSISVIPNSPPFYIDTGRLLDFSL